MPATGTPAGDFGAWFFDAGECGRDLIGHLRGAVRVMAGAPGPGPGPGWRAGPGRRRTRQAWGPGEWPGGSGGPPWGPWPAPPGFPRGPKASRGDVRAPILALLREGPRNGYQIMSEIEERSGGAWRPSPGAVYPALQQLADEGLIEAEEESSGRRTFGLTEAGRRHIEENPEAARAAWESMAPGEPGEVPGLFAQAARLAASIVQVAHAGTPAQVREAEALLQQTRRRMYQILAGDDVSGEDEEQ